MKSVWLLKASEDSNDNYVKSINTAGFSTSIIPVLSFKFINKDVIKDTLKVPDQHSGIVFTSPRAVQAIAEVFQLLSTEFHEEWNKKKIFVIGEATSSAVKQLLSFKHIIGENSFTAKNLAPIIIKETVEFDKPLFIPCGNQKREELPRLLAEEHRDFRSLMCYETHPHPELSNTIKTLNSVGNKPNFIIFFSPSGVKYTLPVFKTLDINLENVQVIAIGPTTNSTLVENEINVSGVCPSPSPDGVVHVLKGLS